jgi:hypothetical protein
VGCISGYPECCEVCGDSVLPIVDIADTSMCSTGTTKKVTVSALLNANGPPSVPAGASTIGLGLGLLTAAPAIAAGTTVTVTAGTVYLALVTCGYTQTVTYLGLWLTGAGTGVTPDGQATGIALYAEAGGAPVATTTGVMDSALTGTPGFAEAPIYGPGSITSYVVRQGANYYLAFMSTLSGTQPGIAAAGASGGTAIPPLNGHYPAITITGQTVFPAMTPAAATLASTACLMYAR